MAPPFIACTAIKQVIAVEPVETVVVTVADHPVCAARAVEDVPVLIAFQKTEAILKNRLKLKKKK